jgi:acetyl-CoA carboxylase biotin carboxyl carrier protein
VDLKEIKTLIDLMKKNGVAVFKMEREGFKITLKTDAAGAVRIAQAPQVVPIMEAAAPALPAATPQAPDAAPFVSPGQEVTPDTVVCIIEAMKVMNEVKAEVAGTIAEVCAENGKPVQFGQALFRLK